jgi:hypothetical protein
MYLGGTGNHLEGATGTGLPHLPNQQMHRSPEKTEQVPPSPPPSPTGTPPERTDGTQRHRIAADRRNARRAQQRNSLLSCMQQECRHTEVQHRQPPGIEKEAMNIGMFSEGYGIYVCIHRGRTSP